MSNHYTVIDQTTWPRATHCAVFRAYTEPCYCITFELDITRFHARTKAHALSFTMAMIYAVSYVANGIEAFRYRFVEGAPVLYDQIDTAFTYLPPESELFKVVQVPLGKNLTDYVTRAIQTAEAQEVYFTGPLGNDVFQFSPLPWIRYTHISHTISGKQDQATPLFDWGKYQWRDDRLWLPFSVQVHHSFVDGIHIGQFADALQMYLDQDAPL